MSDDIKENKKFDKKKTVYCCIGVIVIIAILVVVGTFIGGNPGSDNGVSGADSFNVPGGFSKIDGGNSTYCEYKDGNGYIITISEVNDDKIKEWFSSDSDYTVSKVNGLTNVYEMVNTEDISDIGYLELIKVDDHKFVVCVSGHWDIKEDQNILSVDSHLEDSIKEFNKVNSVSPLAVDV